MGIARIAAEFAGRRGYVIREQYRGDSYLEVLKLLRPVATEHALIRMGGAGDGGYLVPNDLDGIKACFSPGVDLIATFERDCIARGMRSFQIDASVEESPLVDAANVFERKYLGICNDLQMTTLDRWVAEKMPDPADELILQMDIEGHEWLTLAQASEDTLRRFRIIVLELHHLDWLPIGGEVFFRPVIEKLREIFEVVHIHANNVMEGFPVVSGDAIPPFMEVSLLRKDRVRNARPISASQLPHVLDQDNIPDRAPISIPHSVFA